MANILQIEDAIIDRLNDRLGEYTDAINASLPPEQAISINVSELPLNPAEIGVPVSATQIWVAFREESFDPPPTGGVSNPLKPPSQGRRITYEVIIRGQQLRLKGHQRIYPILDKIRDVLSGYMPRDIHTSNGLTKPLFPVKAGFTNMGAGLWVYSMTFSCTAIYTPPIQEV